LLKGFLILKRRVLNKLCSIVQVVKYYSSMNIQQNTERYEKLARITKKVTPQHLRYSIATHFLNNRKDIRRIQHFLGHRSLTKHN